MDTRETIAGAVLAGGSSRRMGRDKRFVELDGSTLLERAVAAVATLTDEVIVVGGTTPPGGAVPGARQVPDRRPDRGPLAGIETALLETDRPVVVVVAVDHPWVVPGVLARLADQLAAHPDADAAVLETDGPPQPLVAAYRRAAAATVTRLLDEGVSGATRALSSLTVTTVAAQLWRSDDAGGSSLRDVDTPADLRRAVSGEPGVRPAGTR